MNPRPTVGRIVHFQCGLEALAAIVTAVHGDDGTVDLTVFVPGMITYEKKIAYSEDGERGTWHWPART